MLILIEGMKRLFLKIAKWTGIVLVSLFLLISAGLYLFKDEICGVVITEVNKHLRSKVSVEKVDLTFWSTFPNLSVDFDHVFIQDSYQNSTPKDTLLYSERIRLRFNPLDIWNENYRVKKVQVYPGNLHLKVNKKGEVNYDILKPTEDTVSSPFKFELKKVEVEGLRFAYSNKATGQGYRSRVDELELSGNFSQEQFAVRARSEMRVNKIRSGEVTLLSNRPVRFDVEIHVDKTRNMTTLKDALIHISDLPFQVNGSVSDTNLSFNIRSENIELADLANNLSVSQMDEVRNFNGKGKVFFDLDIDGPLQSAAPANVDCSFGIRSGELTEPVNRLKVRDIHLDGKYSNRGGKEKEFLKLSGIRFTTAGGPFSGNLLLTQFESPHFEGAANGSVDLTVLHSLFRIPLVEAVNGGINVHSDFDVKALPRADETLDYSVLKCEGDIRLRNVSLKLEEDKRTFRNMNGRMYLRNDEAGIEQVSVEVGSSDITVDGVFQNIVPYFKDQGKLFANIQLKSRNVDISDLGATTKEEKIQDGRQFVLPNDLDGNVYLEILKMKYEEHEFSHLAGNMLLGERILHFPSIKVNTAGADVTGDLTIEERTPEIFHIITNVTSNNIQFKPLFREWNNFRQEVINENNVYGKAQAKVYFEAPFDLRSGVISKSIKSEVFLRILDGRLKGVDAFKSITESLKTSSSAKLAIGSKNISSLERKLLDLKFETLENTFIIRNGRMEIPNMLIQSNAMDIEVSGTHTFENMINYRFAFRFRDLKDKEMVSEFGEEEDDDTGVRLYMKMYGPIDDPTIEWDKEAKKEDARENREQAKQDVKSILKTEFGFYQNDTAVKIYQEKKKGQERIELEFGDEKDSEGELPEPKKPAKDSKLKDKLNKLKEQSEKEKKQEVEFEFD